MPEYVCIDTHTNEWCGRVHNNKSTAELCIANHKEYCLSEFRTSHRKIFKTTDNEIEEWYYQGKFRWRIKPLVAKKYDLCWAKLSLETLDKIDVIMNKHHKDFSGAIEYLIALGWKAENVSKY